MEPITPFIPAWADPKDPRVLSCWRLPDCGSCLRGNSSCGWCPYSATCVPLPPKGHLLSPIHSAHICPLPWEERYELRTATLGCNCSTTTFLAAIITCISTLVGLLVLVGVVKCLRMCLFTRRAQRGGWEVREHEGVVRSEGVWVRKSPGVWAWVQGKWRGYEVDGERQPLLIE